MAEKTVLITGCSTGIGRLTATTFHREGWNVVATMRAPERETELSTLPDVLVTELDVTAPPSIDRAVAACLERFGGLDVAVNNAGRGGHALLEASSDAFTRGLFETNVFGVMNVCRAVLPIMRRAKQGRIINVTSMAGMMGLPNETSYSATKFAVEGMTEALAFEVKPLGIQAKTVAPGAYLATSFNDNANEADFDAGGDELAAYANRLREHFMNSVKDEGGEKADPQEVADKIYECATADTPVHNPVGKDAELILTMMGGAPRQEFLDRVEPLLLPQ